MNSIPTKKINHNLITMKDVLHAYAPEQLFDSLENDKRYYYDKRIMAFVKEVTND